MSKKAFSSTLYHNPNLKPTSYLPGRPVFYWGLPSDLGFTYSEVSCMSCGKDSMLADTSTHCPYCGTDEISKIKSTEPTELRQSLLHSPYSTVIENCSSCGQALTTSCADLSGIEEVHCPGCGKLMSEFYESLNAIMHNEESKMAKSKAALQKVIADLRKHGEKVLAEELEKELKSMDEQEEGKAALDSGVDKVPYTGDREDDAETMIDEEKATPTPVEEQELDKAVAQVEVLLKHGVQATIVKTAKGYSVKATEELEQDDEIVEKDADEEQPDIVDEATAHIIIRANARKGMKTRVTRVESGFVVAAIEEEKKEEKAESPIPDQQTMLPEDKAGQKPLTAIKYEEKAVEEKKDEVKCEEKECEPMTAEEAEKMVASLHKEGKSARVTCVAQGKYVVASVIPDQETVLPEEKAAETKDETIDEKLADVKEEDKEPQILSEEEVEKAVAALHKDGKDARVTKVIGGFVVAEEEKEHEALETKEEEKEEHKAADEEPKILSEDEAEKAVASINAQGKDARVTKVAGGYVVAEEEKVAEEEEMKAEEKVEDEVKEIKQDAKDDSKEVLEDLVPPSEMQAEEKKDEVQTFDEKIDEKKAEAEEGHEKAAEEKKDEVKSEEVKVEEKADEKEEDKFEPLTDVDEMKADDEEDVVMLSQVDAEQNPFYNVIVKGTPVARIALKDQANHEQIAEYFANENYAMDLVDAMLKFGVAKTLRKVNAKFYANEITNKNLVEKVSAQKLDEYNRKYADAVATVRDDLADRLAMVVAASNKNFFKSDVHHLKVALFDAIEAALSSHNIKLSDETLAEAVETGFESGAAPFFGSMLDKAVGYLDMPKEALASLKQAIGEANIQSLAYEDMTEEEQKAEDEKQPEETDDGKTYAQWLSHKNVPVAPTTTNWKSPDELMSQYSNKK